MFFNEFYISKVKKIVWDQCYQQNIVELYLLIRIWMCNIKIVASAWKRMAEAPNQICKIYLLRIWYVHNE